MSFNALSEARCAAVVELQALRARRPHGTFQYEIADYAVSLALSDTRPDSDFFVINALKDARSILIRRARRDRERGFLSLDGAAGSISGQEVVHAMADSQRFLEDDIAWQDAYQHLLMAVGSQRLLLESLKGWRDGELLAETADRLGISRDYVKKLRRRIREIAVNTFVPGGLH